ERPPRVKKGCHMTERRISTLVHRAIDDLKSKPLDEEIQQTARNLKRIAAPSDRPHMLLSRSVKHLPEETQRWMRVASGLFSFFSLRFLPKNKDRLCPIRVLPDESLHTCKSG